MSEQKKLEGAPQKIEGEDEISPKRAAQIRQLQAWLKEHPYGEQDENGVDISLLRENLKLTYSERLDRLQQLVHGKRVSGVVSSGVFERGKCF
jgi:hypothetical protein